jgi:sodium transport system permease protein
MSISNIKWILIREIRDQLRDRRTTFMIFVLPVLLYPLLGVSLMQMSQFMLKQPSKVLIVGAHGIAQSPPLFDSNRFSPELFGEPESARLLELTFAREAAFGAEEELPRDPEERRAVARRLMEEGGFDAAVIFSSDFAQQLEQARAAVLRRAERRPNDTAEPDEALADRLPGPGIIPNSSKAKADLTVELLRNVLGEWSDRIGNANLEASDVPIIAARPFVPTIERTEEDEARRSARFWAQLFPIFMVLWAMTGAFYPAVDLCAGEKERGTLETLLSSPARRSEIVLGKLLTVMLFSMATSVLNLLSIGITGLAVMHQLPRLGPPPLTAWIWLPIALVPVAALFSALCLAMAAFARSTKEGQYYLMPLILITMPLVMAPISPNVELTLGNALIPVTGLVLLLRTLLEGQVAQALPMVAPVAAVTLACCLLAIRWAVEQFNSESVLFRESERLDLRLWARHLVREREPTPGVAMAISCGVLILVAKFFLSLAATPPTDFQSFAANAVVSQLAMILAPTLLMTVFLVSSPRQTLLLKLPLWKTIPFAALLAVVFHPVAMALQSLVMRLYPISDELRSATQGLEQVFSQAPYWQLVLLIAVLPAVCEELAFRGFILSGLRRSGNTARAIVISALLFGFAHGVMQQSMIASIVGMLIGYVAVKTGSILPGIVFHAIHNSLAVGVMKVAKGLHDGNEAQVLREDVDASKLPQFFDKIMELTGAGGLQYRTGVLVACVLGTAVVLAWFSLLRHPKTPEELHAEALRDSDD